MLHFQQNLHKHLRITRRKDFANELAGLFDPDHPAYTQHQGVNKLKEVLNKWGKTYPKLKATAQRTDLETVFTYLLV